MPIPLLNNSERAYKKSRKLIFDPETVQNNPLRGPNFDLNEAKNGQNDPLRRPNFGVEIMFWWVNSPRNFPGNFWLAN